MVPSPHGPAGAERVDTAPGVVEPLNAAELVWTAQQRGLVEELCDGAVEPRTVGDLFDRVHATWLATQDRPDPEPLINAFGVALGDLLTHRVPGLAWASFRDADGSELVVSHPTNDLVLFPLAAVRREWGTAPEGWLVSSVHRSAGAALAVLAGGQPEA
ncbi:DUF3806 domain-containing protein [Cellulomonas fimi]|uniref:DUF3806 domain-containing protein n=1 Tax=Cellulomonas fimi (strain ATCC 484 / DSM 20113 / JCM 1341 / CCUG 24087 / LMG 16345 / NBRC 15513 / NCIMB 8980 / NCTC 7547 / NRS-133) TaxID=590998 RepID=F4H8C1_CELFA|nr:DUF3806 domain-containing protein [Cellulomonas fimi]AEE44678.1 hypothetical protein Celf_0538 [Cellulomonas fimi ATCC 484]NNH07490.1 DUF3806 domain-containing protein [Cellulomonas fimi]VEH26983.1 Domain of uncharacterised function (DUF3806) [Cellulomonas fimi]